MFFFLHRPPSPLRCNSQMSQFDKYICLICKIFFTGLLPHFCQRSRILLCNSPSLKRQAEPTKKTNKQIKQTDKQTSRINQPNKQTNQSNRERNKQRSQILLCNFPSPKTQVEPNKQEQKMQTNKKPNKKQTNKQTNKGAISSSATLHPSEDKRSHIVV